MKNVLIIYNPRSGRGTFVNQIDRITAICHECGFIPTFCRIGPGVELNTLAENINIFDILLIAGGDGTLNQVINSLIKLKINIPVGVIPTGTANDFASALGLDSDPVSLVKKLLLGKVLHADVGQVNDRVFINEIGAGLLTAVSYEVGAFIKHRLGKTGYFLKGLEKIWSITPIPVTIEGENFKIDREIVLFLVTNTPVVGSFKNIASKAVINDGLLDLVILKKCSFEQLVFLLIQAFKGKGEHLNSPLIEYYQSPWYRIASPGDVRANIDGEPGVNLPLNIKILPNHLDLMVPASGNIWWE